MRPTITASCYDTWILPGFVAHRIAGDLVGSYALQLTTLASDGVALYLFVRDALGDLSFALTVLTTRAADGDTQPCTPR